MLESSFVDETEKRYGRKRKVEGKESAITFSTRSVFGEILSATRISDVMQDFQRLRIQDQTPFRKHYESDASMTVAWGVMSSVADLGMLELFRNVGVAAGAGALVGWVVSGRK